ncbi:hypothetical protein GCM10027572_11960 [Flexivirga lutea]
MRVSHLQQAIPTTSPAATNRWTRGWLWLAIGVVLVIVTGVAALTFAAPKSRSAADSQTTGAQIGGDLHTVFFDAGKRYVGGHDAVVTSTDGGQHLRPIASLAGADAMGWAALGSSLLVGGHAGLFRSVDQGTTFTKVTAPVSDVHALGGAGAMLYLGPHKPACSPPPTAAAPGICAPHAKGRTSWAPSWSTRRTPPAPSHPTWQPG